MEVSARPKRNWIQEERRKTLGDYTCFCLGCGVVWRYFLEGEAELPATCPHCGGGRRWFEEFEDQVDETCTACGGQLLRRCPHCNEPFSSLFAVDCEECGKQMRPPVTQSGIQIRKTGAPPTAKPEPEEE